MFSIIVIYLLSHMGQVMASQCRDHEFVSPFFVGRSCEDIFDMNPDSDGKSGYYWITNPLQQVYCDMEHTGQSCTQINHRYPETNNKPGYYRLANGEWEHCKMEPLTFTCGQGNWKTIASINGSNCPLEWNNGWHNDTSFCTARSNSSGCHRAIFSTNQVVNYQNVCGRVTGFQKGTPDAFNSRSSAQVDGISITHGDPRQHIWTYAVGLTNEDRTLQYDSNCPCGKKAGHNAPEYVGKNFYCDTANKVTKWVLGGKIYVSTFLWQTSGCFDPNFCCHTTNQPWFYRHLNTITTDDIEVRICRDDPADLEDILIYQLELYVQ